MNPYEPRPECESPTPAKSGTEKLRRHPQTLVLVAWISASIVTTVLYSVVYLFIRGGYALVAALIAIAIIGCLVPAVILRIAKSD